MKKCFPLFHDYGPFAVDSEGYKRVWDIFKKQYVPVELAYKKQRICNKCGNIQTKIDSVK